MKYFFLSKIIVTLFQTLIEVSLWIGLLASLIIGWNIGGFWMGLGALILGFAFEVMFIGAVLVLSDIRVAVRAIETQQRVEIAG